MHEWMKTLLCGIFATEIFLTKFSTNEIKNNTAHLPYIWSYLNLLYYNNNLSEAATVTYCN